MKCLDGILRVVLLDCRFCRGLIPYGVRCRGGEGQSDSPYLIIILMNDNTQGGILHYALSWKRVVSQKFDRKIKDSHFLDRKRWYSKTVLPHVLFLLSGSATKTHNSFRSKDVWHSWLVRGLRCERSLVRFPVLTSHPCFNFFPFCETLISFEYP